MGFTPGCTKVSKDKRVGVGGLTGILATLPVITSGCDVDDDVTVQVGRLRACGGHVVDKDKAAGRQVMPSMATTSPQSPNLSKETKQSFKPSQRLARWVLSPGCIAIVSKGRGSGGVEEWRSGGSVLTASSEVRR